MVLKQFTSTWQVKSVLDPYKLTWFSNKWRERDEKELVLDPYKLTWFSNLLERRERQDAVLDPYEGMKKSL